METKKIRFLDDYVVDDFRKRTSEEESYKGGKEYSLPEASANHFIRTLRAEAVTAPSAANTGKSGADKGTGDNNPPPGPYRIQKDESAGVGKPAFAVIGPDGHVGELMNKKVATAEVAQLNAEAAAKAET